MDSFAKVCNSVIFVTSTADVFNGVTQVETQSLVSDEIPNLDRTSSIVAGSRVVGFGQFFRRLESELERTKFCFWRAMKTVMMSSLRVSGLLRASSIWRSLNDCSNVTSVTGGGGPKFDGLGVEVIIGTLKDLGKPSI